MGDSVWTNSYKVTINGAVANLGDLLHQEPSYSALSSDNGGDVYKSDNTKFSEPTLQGGGPSVKNTSFNNTLDRYSKITSHWNFEDNANTCGYKYNGIDIGPSCCAKYTDYTSNLVNASIPDWVDYYKVFLLAKGGNNGKGRDYNDEKWQGTTGSTGGFICWRSPMSLGGNGKKLNIIFLDTHTKLEIKNSGNTVEAYCQGNTGLQGNSLNGNDSGDTHPNSRSAVAGGQSSFLNGNQYGSYAQPGIRSAHKSRIPNLASNNVSDQINGWGTYGKGADWVNDTDRSTNIGEGVVRVYSIAYSA
uniref:Uncharacterized protein n=1 Tax=viral metagenome TaxID=1070528 RepID=A0A6C0JCL1_9ZZZZ